MTLKLLTTAAVLAVFATAPVLACEQHKAHSAMTTAAAAPVILAPVETALPLPQSPVTEEAAMSVPPQPVTAPSGYGGCRERKATTVYLTN